MRIAIDLKLKECPRIPLQKENCITNRYILILMLSQFNKTAFSCPFPSNLPTSSTSSKLIAYKHRPLPLKGIAVPIEQLLRGPNIHSLSARDRGREFQVLAEEVAGRTAGVADFGDAEGIIWIRERREISNCINNMERVVDWRRGKGRGYLQMG